MAENSSGELFSNVDAAWLHMESPTSMAMITGVMTFAARVDSRRLVDTFEYRMVETYPRFKQRVREPVLSVGLPRWENDPHFNIHSHIHRIALPEPAGQAELEALVGDLMSTPLDFTKPLWQLHLVDNYLQGSAFVIRLHHAIADGIALMQVLLSLTDESPDAPWPVPTEKQRRSWNPIRWVTRPAAATLRLVKGAASTARHWIYEGFETVTDPSKALDVAKLGTSGTKALAKLLLIGPDQKTIFKGNCGVRKRAAWTQPIPLAEVKAIGKSMNSTINDVLLAAVTGALRRYLEGRGEPTEGVDIRAIVPVNLRSPGEFAKLGNRFGLVFLSLPVGVRDPLKRLLVIHHRMDEIKNSPEAVVAFGILSAIGLTPVQIERIIVKIFGMKATAVMTNVPGPRQHLYLAGQRLDNFLFWVPSPANLGMGISILSYAGQVTIGVNTDSCLVPDPDVLVAGVHTELDEMKLWWEPEGIAGEEATEAVHDLDTEVEKLAAEAQAILAEADALDSPAEEGKLEPQPRQVKSKKKAGLKPPADPLAAPVAEDSPTGDRAVAGNGARSHVDMAASATAIPTNGRCTAITRAGAPCKNQALPGSNTCRVHMPGN